MAADLAAALACIEPFGFDLHSALDFAPDADGAAPGSSAAAPPEPLPLAASAFVCIEPFGIDLHPALMGLAPDADGVVPGSSATTPPEPSPLFVASASLHLFDGAPPQPVPPRSPFPDSEPLHAARRRRGRRRRPPRAAARELPALLLRRHLHGPSS